MATQEVTGASVESKYDQKDYGRQDSSSDIENYAGKLVAAESEHEIKYRTCSWQKVSKAALTCYGYLPFITDSCTALL